jgi:HPt (histidine-containing phosphotransfer) domain-containing protein
LNTPTNPAQTLQQIKQEYNSSIPGKVAKLHQLVDTLHASWGEASLKALRIEVHRLAGNAGVYGYLRVSEICKKFEDELIQHSGVVTTSEIDTVWISSLKGYVEDVRTAFSQQD